MRKPNKPTTKTVERLSTSIKKRTARQTGILVLGMHRSGTSALTGTLIALGCSAPRTVIGATDANQKGHWESVAINDLNEEILRDAGSIWSDWRPFDPEWIRSAPGTQSYERAKDVLKQEFSGSALFVLKDPRICRMADFWLPVLADENVDVKTILALRHPIEVARSLATRDKIPMVFGILIWLRHVLDAERVSRRFSRAFVFYPDFLSNWRQSLHQVSKDLGVSWPRKSQLVYAEIDSFLSKDLHRERLHNDASHSDISELALGVFQLMRQLSLGSKAERTKAQQALDDIYRNFDAASSVFGPILAQTEMFSGPNSYLRLRLPGSEMPLVLGSESGSFADPRSELAAREAIRKEISSEIGAAQSAEIDAVRVQLDEIGTQLSHERSQHNELQEAHAALVSDLRERQQDVVLLKAQLDVEQRRLTEAEVASSSASQSHQQTKALLDEELKLNAAYRARLDEAMAKQTQLLDSHSETLQRLEWCNSQISNQNDTILQLSSELAGLRSAVPDARRQVETLETALQEEQHRRQALEAELTELRVTTSRLSEASARQVLDANTLQTAMDAERELSASLSRSLEDETIARSNLEIELEAERQHRSTLSTEVAALQQASSELREANAKQEFEINAINTAFKSEQELSASLTSQLESNTSSHSKAESALLDERQKRSSLEAELEKLRQTNFQLNEAIVSRDVEFDAVKIAVSAERELVATLTRELEGVTVARNKVESELKAEREYRATLDTELETLLFRVFQMEETNALLMGRVEAAKADLAEAHGRASTLANDLEQARSGQSLYENVFHEERKHRSYLENELEALRPHAAQLAERISVLNSDIERANSALTAERQRSSSLSLARRLEDATGRPIEIDTPVSLEEALDLTKVDGSINAD